MKKIPDHELKIIMSAVVLTLLAVVGGLAFVYKNDQQQMAQKDNKIGMLIDEVGQVKDQNEQLYQYFVSEKGHLNSAVAQMSDVQKQIAEAGNSNNQQIAQNLKIADSQLTNIVQEKEATIQSLNNANSTPVRRVAVNNGDLNLLFVGENEQLTDAIMLVNVNSSNHKVTLISIPRDFFYQGRKINEYYERYGIDSLENAVAAITGVQPTKYVVFDMNAFAKVVDMMGGIDLTVPKSIYDRAYPGPNNSYLVISFQKGYQHMDGQHALEYARSRESTTDFDRSQRQQLIFAALRQKAEEIDLKDNIPVLSQIYSAVQNGIVTDISLLDAINYYNNYRTFDLNTGNGLSTQNFLYSTYNSAGQYILLPYKHSFTAIQNYIQSLVG